MYYDLLKTELFRQKEVYLAVKAGERDTVCYKPYQDKEYGTQDANYTNRLRLAYYLLYGEVDDEEVIAWLFEEELKDREENSFQGIGAALEVLTFLLKKYNVNDQDDDLYQDSDLHQGDHLRRYDALFARAKNANFDCACGYDADLPMVAKLSDNSLLDCIYLCQDMEFLAVMEPLVEQWRASVAEWGESERTSLILFYSFLGKEEKNEALYQEQLALAKQKGREQDVVRAYGDFIRHYLNRGMAGMAHRYLDEVRGLAQCPKIRRARLMGDLLEEAFEVVCAECGTAKEICGGENAERGNACRETEDGKKGEVCGGGEDAGEVYSADAKERAEQTGKTEGMETAVEAAETEKTEDTKELWEWAKAELIARTNRYGNLYQKGIAAAKAMGDAYAAQLEQEYRAWWEEWHIE